MMDETPLSWPDLVGFTEVHIVPPDAMVTMDYRTDRVRVHVDEEGKVAFPPTVG